MPSKLLERMLITVRNTGKADVENFTYCSHESATQGLSSLQVAELNQEDRDLANEMNVTGAPTGAAFPDDVFCVDYGLLSPLKGGETRELVIMAKTTDHVVAYPRERKQLDLPMVLATIPSTMFSMYEIAEEKTTVKLGSERKATKVSEGGRSFIQTKDVLTLDTLNNVKPFTKETMNLHITLLQPLLRVTKVERDIYVSHWGKVRVEEQFDLRNDASSLKGEFSRADLLLKDDGASGAALRFRGGLPGGAYDIRYRDEIGNISTSIVSKGPDMRYISIGFEPRFPLMGGWHTKFEVSYSIGLNWLVAKGKTGLYEMVFTQIPVITDTVYENIVTRIHLPEGSHVAELPALKNQQSIDVGEERTFMSVLPRPVVTMTQTNIVAELALPDPIAEIKYSYQPWLKFDKLVGTVLVSLVVAMLWKFLASIDLNGASSKVKRA
jgi:hypothetical protein